MSLFSRIGKRIRKKAIEKATKKIEKVIEKDLKATAKESKEIIWEEGESDVQKLLLTFAISILEKLGKKYIESVQANIEKDGFQVNDLLGNLKKEVKK